MCMQAGILTERRNHRTAKSRTVEIEFLDVRIECSNFKSNQSMLCILASHNRRVRHIRQPTIDKLCRKHSLPPLSEEVIKGSRVLDMSCAMQRHIGGS